MLNVKDIVRGCRRNSFVNQIYIRALAIAEMIAVRQSRSNVQAHNLRSLTLSEHAQEGLVLAFVNLSVIHSTADLEDGSPLTYIKLKYWII